MVALEIAVRDWLLDGARDAGEAGRTWQGPTALVIQGPAGVGKTFALTEAAKSAAQHFATICREGAPGTVFSWDVMEINNNSADERLALLETLIFQAKDSKQPNRKRGLRFHNYAFALAAYARRRRPGLKAHEAHPEFNRMRNALVRMGGATGGATLELMNEVGLNAGFDEVMEFIETYTGEPDSFLSLARGLMGRLAGKTTDVALEGAGQLVADDALSRLDRARSEFRKRVQALYDREGEASGLTRELELMLPEGFALDCALNVARGHALQMLAIVDRAEAINSAHELAWLDRLIAGAPGCVWIMLGERTQGQADRQLKVRLSQVHPGAGERLTQQYVTKNPEAVDRVLTQQEIPQHLRPQVVQRAEGRPIYAKLWSEIYLRNLERLGDEDRAADFLPQAPSIVSYYLANMPESLRLQVELAALVPSMPVAAFYDLLRSESIGEGSALIEDVRAIGRASAPEDRIELHEELRDALLVRARGRQKLWIGKKQYELALWALHRLLLPGQNERPEDRNGYLSLFEGAARALTPTRLARLAAMVRTGQYVTIGAGREAVGILTALLEQHEALRLKEWTIALSKEAEVLQDLRQIYACEGAEERVRHIDQNYKNYTSEDFDVALAARNVFYLLEAAAGRMQLASFSARECLENIVGDERVYQLPSGPQVQAALARLIACLALLYPEYQKTSKGVNLPFEYIDISRPSSIDGANACEVGLDLLAVPDDVLHDAVLARPWQDMIVHKRDHRALPTSSDAERFMGRLFRPGMAVQEEPTGYLARMNGIAVAAPAHHLHVLNFLSQVQRDPQAAMAMNAVLFDKNSTEENDPITQSPSFEAHVARIVDAIVPQNMRDPTLVESLTYVLRDELRWRDLCKTQLARAWTESDLLKSARRLRLIEEDGSAPVPFRGGMRSLEPPQPEILTDIIAKWYKQSMTTGDGPLLWSARALGPREGLARRAFVARFPHHEAAPPHLVYLTGGYALQPEKLQQMNLALQAQGETPLIGYDDDCTTFDQMTGQSQAGEGAMQAFIGQGALLWGSGRFSALDRHAWLTFGDGMIRESWDSVIRRRYLGGMDDGDLSIYRRDLPKVLAEGVEPPKGDPSPTDIAAHSEAFRDAVLNRNQIIQQVNDLLKHIIEARRRLAGPDDPTA